MSFDKSGNDNQVENQITTDTVEKSNLPNIISVENIPAAESILIPNEHINTESEDFVPIQLVKAEPVIEKKSITTRSSARLKNIEHDFDNLKNLKNNEKIDNSDNESDIDGNEANLLYYRDNGQHVEEIWTNSENNYKFPKKIIENGLLLFKGEKLMQIINKFYDLSCDLCEDKKKFESLKQLFAHHSNDHKIKPFVSCCTLPGKTYQSSSEGPTKLSNMPAIIMHMAKHLQPSAFTCFCGYQVSRPRFLELHKKTHLPDSEKPFICDYCNKSFCWKNAMQIHMASHLPKEKRKKFVCGIQGCQKTYENPGSLSTHKKNAHKGKKSEDSLICSTCGKLFKNVNAWKEHQLSHRDDLDKFQLQCKICFKWLKNKRCLKSHIMLHSEVDHSCELCNYKTKKPILLKRHQITQHSNERNFSCSHCNKTFKLKRALTVHLAQHTDTPKSYKCEFCERQFRNSTNYYTHRKNLHPKELNELKEKQLEEQRRKRIEAGLEKDDEADYIEAIFDPNLSILKTIDGKIIDSAFLNQTIGSKGNLTLDGTDIASNS